MGFTWLNSSKDTKVLKNGLTECKVTLIGDDRSLKIFFSALKKYSSRCKTECTDQCATCEFEAACPDVIS